jgi:hypothetical protein
MNIEELSRLVMYAAFLFLSSWIVLLGWAFTLAFRTSNT